MFDGSLPGRGTSANAFGVLEHIEPGSSDALRLSNIRTAFEESGIAIIGMSSSESPANSGPASKERWVNCQTGQNFGQKI